jgi:hypothetical protein
MDLKNGDSKPYIVMSVILFTAFTLLMVWLVSLTDLRIQDIIGNIFY